MWTFAEVRRRSILGLIAVALRGGAGKIVSAAALLILSRLLAPADFGVFAILQLPASLASLLADAGLSAALIQRFDALTPTDEQIGFTLRLLFALVWSVLLALLADTLGSIYHLDITAIWALRSLSLEPLISALGTIPGVRLTRALRFGRLAWIEFAALASGQLVAIGLALAGFDLWSLVIGALTTSAAGSILVNVVSPWRPRLKLSVKSSKALLRFGLMYQAQGLFHLAKDNIVPMLGGLTFSSTQVGYVTWSQEIARWPRLPADYVARVGFPAFSRLQNDPVGLGRLLHDALTVVCLLSFSAVAIGMTLGPRLVRLVFPLWEPAIPILLIFLVQTPLDAVLAVLVPLIYAIGQAGRGLRLSIAWAALTWLFSLIALAAWRDVRAMALAFGLATLCTAGLVRHSLPKAIRVQWSSAIGKPLILALALGIMLQAMVMRLE